MKLGVPSHSDTGVGSRLAWVTALRLGFLIVLLAATSFFYLSGEFSRYPASSQVVFVTLGSGLGLAILYAIFLRSGKHLSQLAHAQILLDQLTWTAIVYVSGGPGSGATSFYGLTCLVGAVLIGLRGALVAAASGVGIYALLCVGFATHVLLPPADQLSARYASSFEAIAYPLLTNALGIALVGGLSGYLAERLKRTGGALVLASARAEEAERLAVLGRIAAGLAHEIRNPLSSISGSVEMLSESKELSEEDKALCSIIQREALRLSDLVTDMMNFAGRRTLQPEPTDVVRLAKDVRSLAVHSERSAGGDVTVRYEGPDEPIFAHCDAAQIRQVLWNLVRNGVQLSAAGTEVVIRVSHEGGRVTLEVADQGPGIPEEERSRIFDVFYTTRTSGAGIGLAVVKRIVDDHEPFGASISVRCPSPCGAVFSLTLREVEAPPPSSSVRSWAT